jgi:dTDP-4-amino-4,6-dideoxygalactose transaminase
LYEKLLLLRNHGITKDLDKFTINYKLSTINDYGDWYYEMQELGFNYRITDFQCALGLSQLKKLDKFIKRRRDIVEIYNKELSKIDEIILPLEKPYVKSSWHIYCIRLKNAQKRKKIFERVRKQRIGVQVHYIPVHLQPYYRSNFTYKEDDFPKAEDYYRSTITIPLFVNLNEKQIKYIVNKIKEAMNG